MQGLDLIPHPASPQTLAFHTFDADAVNAVCNDPAVLPGLALGRGALDMSGLIADDRNVFFLGEHGGAMFHRVAPRVYAAHDFFLPTGRGAWALAASREMLARMFSSFRARMVFAETPVEHRACRIFNRWLGFRSEGVGTRAPYPGAAPLTMETFVLEAAPCR